MNPPKIDPSKTALVLIDLQKGIVPMPVAPHTGASVVANAVKLARRFREAKAPVVLVRVTFAPDFSDAVKTEVDSPMTRREFPAGWDEIVPELGPEPGDIVVTKRNWGAFYGTDLELQLRRRGVTTIVLGGIATKHGRGIDRAPRA